MKTIIRLITSRIACTALLLAFSGSALADHHHGATPDREVSVSDPITTVDGTARPVLTVDGTATVAPGTETVDGTARTANPTLTVDGTAEAAAPTMTVDGTARSFQRATEVEPASTTTVDGTANRALSFAQPIETVDGTARAGGDCWHVETVDGTAAIIDAPQGVNCDLDMPEAE